MALALSLSTLIERGGVYYNIAGGSSAEALSAATKAMALPKGVDRELLLNAILEREALMPTAIGNGVAIPHPRNPIISEEEEQRVGVFFLKTPISYNALDRKPVSVLFLILSSNARSHLSTLAELSHLCQKEEFLGFLAGRPSTEELVAYIEKSEKSLEPKGSR